jgi:hypothetical protein
MNLKSLFGSLFAAFLAVTVTSCVPIDPYYGDAGYSSTSYSSGTVYRSSPVYVDDSSYGYGGGYGGGYGTRYSTPGYSSGYFGGHTVRACSICGHNPCSCSRSSHTDSHDHDSRPSDGHGRITLLRGNDGDHGSRPEGTHSREWYEKRGYDLKEYKYKDEAGHTHGKKR